jgi:hypothetical protein
MKREITIPLLDITAKKRLQDEDFIKYLINANKEKLINDVSNINFNKYATATKKSLKEINSLFCDNVIFFGLLQKNNLINNKVRYYIDVKIKKLIIGLFNEHNIDVSHAGNITFKKSIPLIGKPAQTRHLFNNIDHKNKIIFDTSYEGNKELFICSWKIELSNYPFKQIRKILKSVFIELKKYNIFLSDLDITTDNKYSFDSKDVIQALEHKGYKHEDDNESNENEGVIVRHTSGNDCVMIKKLTNNMLVRSKLYNKYVCQLTHGSVSTFCKNHLFNLVNPPNETLKNSFQKGNKTGLTRIEITIYSSKIQKTSFYKSLISDFKKSIGDKFYVTPYKLAYKALEEIITTNTIYHNLNSNVVYLAYWYNSSTCNLYGITQKIFKPSDINFILNNYSFANKPINYIEYQQLSELPPSGASKMPKALCNVIIKHSTYNKTTGTTFITKNKLTNQQPEISEELYHIAGLNDGNIKWTTTDDNNINNVEQINNTFELSTTIKYDIDIKHIDNLISNFQQGKKLLDIPINTQLIVYAIKEIHTKYGLSYLLLCKNHILDKEYQTFYSDPYNSKVIKLNISKLLNYKTFYYMNSRLHPLYKIIKLEKYFYSKANNKLNSYKIRLFDQKMNYKNI